RLADQKGIPYLLEAMAALSDRFPQLTLLLAGDGPSKESLARRAAELGIEERVRFLGVRLDMPQLFQVFDLMVLPSVWDGLPMVLLEAMAAGCPIVATAVGGVPMAIRHEVSGLLVEPRNPKQLADAIATLLSNDALRRRYA